MPVPPLDIGAGPGLVTREAGLNIGIIVTDHGRGIRGNDQRGSALEGEQLAQARHGLHRSEIIHPRDQGQGFGHRRQAGTGNIAVEALWRAIANTLHRPLPALGGGEVSDNIPLPDIHRDHLVIRLP